jgi:hypothetical protein
MSEYTTAYQVACSPGPRAAAAVMQVPGGTPVLVVYLDPVNMTIQGSPTKQGSRELADFCRELAHEAAKLAQTIDPDGEPPVPQVSWPRHALNESRVVEDGS